MTARGLTGYPFDGYDGTDASFEELTARVAAPPGVLSLPGVMSGLDMLDVAARRTLAVREDRAALRNPDRDVPPAVYGQAGRLAALARDLAVSAA